MLRNCLIVVVVWLVVLTVPMPVGAVEQILFEVEVGLDFVGPIPLGDGRLFAVQRNLEGFHSTDEGRTWVSAGGLADLAGTPISTLQSGLLRPQSLIRLQSGAIAITYWRGVSVPEAPMAKQACYFIKSVNEGANWSTPVLITWPGTPAYPTWMVQAASGRLVLANEYWYSHQASDTGLGVCTAFYSDDEGASWAESGDSLILRQASGALFDTLAVPCIAETGDGRLLMVTRNEVGRIARSYSSDGGVRWTAAALTALVSSNSEIWLTRVPTTGDLLCVWNQTDAGEVATGFYRGRLSSAISQDSGQTWGNFRTVASSPGMKTVSRILDPPPPAFVKSSGAVPPKELTADEGFYMNTFPRVKFVGETAYLVYNHRVYVYPEGSDNWVRTYNSRRLRACSIQWYYEADPSNVSTVTVNVAADASIWNVNPDWNRGAFHRTDARMAAAGAADMRGFIKFDLDMDWLQSVGSAGIRSATFKGNGWSLVDFPAAGETLDVIMITEGDWVEGSETGGVPAPGSGVTWNTRNGDPAHAWTTAGQPGGITHISAPWYPARNWEQDATDLVKAWADGAPNYGVYITHGNAIGGTTRYSSFWTREAESDQTTYPGAMAPELLIELVTNQTLIVIVGADTVGMVLTGGAHSGAINVN